MPRFEVHHFASPFVHVRYDRTTGVPDNGTVWRKCRVVPRACPSHPIICAYFHRVAPDRYFPNSSRHITIRAVSTLRKKQLAEKKALSKLHLRTSKSLFLQCFSSQCGRGPKTCVLCWLHSTFCPLTIGSISTVDPPQGATDASCEREF